MATEEQVLSVVIEEVDQITSITTNGVDEWIEKIGNELLKAFLFIAEVFEKGNLHQLLNILVVLSILFIQRSKINISVVMGREKVIQEQLLVKMCC